MSRTNKSRRTGDRLPKSRRAGRRRNDRMTSSNWPGAPDEVGETYGTADDDDEEEEEEEEM